jgi:hypothetical protein
MNPALGPDAEFVGRDRDGACYRAQFCLVAELLNLITARKTLRKPLGLGKLKPKKGRGLYSKHPVNWRQGWNC